MDNTSYPSITPYVDKLSQLTPERIPCLAAHVHREIRFVDPFNDVVGWTAMSAIFEDMYKKLDHVTWLPHHTQQQGCIAYVRWTFSAESRSTGVFNVQGMSCIECDEEGLITLHRDYWDASELMQRLPIFGHLVGVVRRKLSCD